MAMQMLLRNRECDTLLAHKEEEMKLHKNLLRITALAAMALMFAFSARMVSAQSADSKEISNLLALAKSHAVEAEDDAADLDSFARSQLHWRSHLVKLEQIRSHINSLGQIHKELMDKRSEGAPWQQKAVDQIDPLIREMAALLTTTINHFNENPSRIHFQAYREYAHSNYEVASKTSRMIRDLVDYDEAKSKAESFEAQLELPTVDKN
jgi:hypothetical protein